MSTLNQNVLDKLRQEPKHPVLIGLSISSVIVLIVISNI
jgi:hypothetical protein